MKIATAIGTILCAAVAAGVWAQQQQRPPVFRGESVLVTVDAYPQRDRRIVEGLTATDFQILEDGKPQNVESVEFVRIEPSLSESARRDPNSVTEMLTQAADPHNRVFVVFLDRLQITVGSSHTIRRPLVDSLNRIIGPNDLFAVMTQNTDARALTFGRRLLSVEEQLSKYWDWGERDRLGFDPTDFTMESTLKTCFEFLPPSKPGCIPPTAFWKVSDNGQERFLYELLIDRRREDRTLTALERLVERLAGMREARTVVLTITEGWRLFPENQGLANEAGRLTECTGPPRPPVGSAGGRVTMGDPNTGGPLSYTYVKDCTSELVRLASLDGERRLRDLTVRANRANVSFYPVNPLGLTSFDTPIRQSQPPSLQEDGNRLRNRATGLRTLAEATDGIAIVDTNDLAAGMRRIVDDVSAYYLLGYYSTNTTHDGRFRRIEVKMKAPGLNVRARRGYFAPSDKPARGTIAPAPAGPEPPKGLDAALGELSRLRSAAGVFARGSIVDGTVRVVAELSSSKAGIAPWTNGADVQLVLTAADGSTLPAIRARIEPGSRGVLLTAPVAGAPTSLRAVVRVAAAGESVEETADIRRSVSGLVGDGELSRGRPAATSALRGVADLQYRRTERVHAEWPVSGEIDQRTARLLGRNGQPLAVPVTVTERETDRRRVVAADLNLAPLSAGDYVIELTVGRGSTVEVRLVAFRVLQ